MFVDNLYCMRMLANINSCKHSVQCALHRRSNIKFAVFQLWWCPFTAFWTFKSSRKDFASLGEWFAVVQESSITRWLLDSYDEGATLLQNKGNYSPSVTSKKTLNFSNTAVRTSKPHITVFSYSWNSSDFGLIYVSAFGFLLTSMLTVNLCDFRFVYLYLSQKEPTSCDRVVEFIIPMFLNCSTCFGQHTTHHQELKNCNCSLWFYICFWLLVAAMAEPQPSQQPAVKNVCKTRGCNCSFWVPDGGWCVARNMLSN
jgi:hypothetical protein